MLQLTADGLALGASYALLAIGFTLVFGVLRRVNLAYGASIMLGLYLGIWLHQRFHVHPLLLGPIVVLISVAAGAYVERLCFAPHAERAAATAMAAAFAIWMQLQEIGTLLLPLRAYAFPAPFDMTTSTMIGPVELRVEQVVALGCAVLACAALWRLLYRTRFGLAVRAVTEDRQAAGCVGINVALISAAIFAIASALGGAAGYLIVNIDGQITASFAMWATLKGMVAALLGGLGSLPGAMLGGLLLGVLETHVQNLLGPQYRDVSGYALLFLMLWLYPAGFAALWRARPKTPSTATEG